jgi:hypothetical protein
MTQATYAQKKKETLLLGVAIKILVITPLDDSGLSFKNFFTEENPRQASSL